MMSINPKSGNNLLRRIRELLSRPDFRSNPILAVWKRLWWRIRWQLTDNDWILTLPNGLRISIPKSGAGALIYYQGWSEPEVAAFLLRLLRPGMNFLDVGAHIGEYVLLAASAVGRDGSVHAFEPDPRNYRILEHNVRINNLTSVHLNQCAVYSSDGIMQLEMFNESSITRLAAGIGTSYKRQLTDQVKVRTITLDTYVEQKAIAKVDVIKIDVEGAELFVLEGARSILERPPEHAPVIVFEYSPANCRNFGYHPSRIIDLLSSSGYRVYLIGDTGEVIATKTVDVHPMRHVNLVAAKDEKKLPLVR
ncbi:MAG: FkbM family methyltransferase [Candidatus Bathyarchaeia archaeon]